MRVTRVFVDTELAVGAQILLPEGAARHVVRVLRLGSGDALTLFNGRGGEFEASIEAIRRDAVSVRIGAHHPTERESPLRLVLLQGIARGEKMDLILQKATELGAHAFVPLKMARSTVRLDERNTATRQSHWQAVVASACEQCGRNTVPQVAIPLEFEQCVTRSADLRLLLAAGDGAASLAEILGSMSRRNTPQHIELLVGPEGGFDPTEKAAALAAGFLACRLGPRVLRTETAGLAALAALQALAGDLR